MLVKKETTEDHPATNGNVPESNSLNPDDRSPYDACWMSRLFFYYMGDAMSLANKRSDEGSSLKGIFYINSRKRYIRLATMAKITKDLWEILEKVPGE